MAKASIKSLKGRVCYNSRGQETVEVDVEVDSFIGRAAAPAGASVSRNEAIAFAQGGARGTIELMKTYSSRLIGLDASDIKALTETLREVDGTGNYSYIGGSAAYAITIACAEAAAKSTGVPLYRLLKPEGGWALPYPLGNVLGGGKHTGEGAPDIQEFLVVPVGAEDIESALRANIAVYREVRRRIEAVDPGFAGGRGDEGAWAPRLKDEQSWEIVHKAVETISQRFGFSVRMGVDYASASLWREADKVYEYRRSGVVRTERGQIDYVIEAARKYKVVYVEDPLHEEDFEGFAELTKKLKGIYVAGDDLLSTNKQRILKAGGMSAGNAAILKVNQAGGLGDALDFSDAAHNLGYALITSHRSGDTTDSHITHLAIATGSKMLKAGVVGGERVAKMNELIRLNEAYLLETGRSMPMKK